MKPTKMRNRQIFKASQHYRSRQVGSPLSRQLRDKYGRRSIRVRTGDTAKVACGEYVGIEGKVASVDVAAGRVAIEGIKGEKGKGDRFDVMIHASKVVVTGLNASDKKRMAKLGAPHEATSAEEAGGEEGSGLGVTSLPFRPKPAEDEQGAGAELGATDLPLRPKPAEDEQGAGAELGATDLPLRPKPDDDGSGDEEQGDEKAAGGEAAAEGEKAAGGEAAAEGEKAAGGEERGGEAAAEGEKAAGGEAAAEGEKAAGGEPAEGEKEGDRAR